MAARGIDANTFSYYPPNFSEDIRKKQGYIFLGSFTQRPTLEQCHQELIHELIIKTNIESKKTLLQIGEIFLHEKQPSPLFHWQLIQASVSAAFWPVLKINLFFIVYVVGNIALVVTLLVTYLKMTDRLLNPTVVFSLICLNYLFNRHFITRIEKNDSHVGLTLAQARKPYFDPFVVFQNLSEISNSMEGFDPHALANHQSQEGWVDPISLDPIPIDQISSSQIVRIGLYAIPILSALKLMLTRTIRECPQGEIPHPLESRSLTTEEKEKFLRETSAFFAIPNFKNLEGCWNVQVTYQDVDAITSQMEDWNLYSVADQNTLWSHITEQLRLIKRKQAFLNLLPRSIGETYFDEDFRSDNVTVPERLTEEQRLEAQQEFLQAPLTVVLMVTAIITAQYSPPHNPVTSTSEQSDTDGPL